MISTNRIVQDFKTQFTFLEKKLDFKSPWDFKFSKYFKIINLTIQVEIENSAILFWLVPLINNVFYHHGPNAFPLTNLSQILNESPVLQTLFATFRGIVNGERQIFGVCDHLEDHELAAELAMDDHPLFGQAGNFFPQASR